MEKQVQYFGKTASGITCQSLFGSAGAFEKVAGAPAFADLETGGQLQKYIATINKEDRKKSAYVLVNALGAGEYFGSNINADFFPWNALTHEGDDYGYKTFLRAHAFQHHANKDPERAFGVPTLALLNSSMKRVELVIKLDREKAKKEGADGIIVRIDNGEFPDVSMGCKVPYDVCSICHNRSKTRADYCQHMMPPTELRHIYGPNKILEDGRKIYVVNLHPRFFDISFVFIGADKTAKVMAKLASRKDKICLGEVCTIPNDSGSSTESLDVRSSGNHALAKVASAESCCDTCATTHGEVKTSSKKKLSEIVKEVPTGTFASKSLKLLEDSEPEIPTDSLDSLAQDSDLGSCCSTAGMMGIVLRPREFQRIVLIKIGEKRLADALDLKNQVFRQVSRFDDSIPYDREFFSQKVASVLQSLVSDRSVFGEAFRIRMTKAATVKNLLPTQTRIEHSLLDKISAAYNGYRRNQLLKMSQAVEAIQSDPKLREEILGINLVNLFMKTSSVTRIDSLDSLAFLTGAYFTDKSGLLSNTAIARALAVSNPELSMESIKTA